jgi:ferric-dicitrate binding protein FerR (iron transport regulator)
MAQCPDTEILLSYLHGEFEGQEKEDVRLHVDTCPDCDRRLREITRLGRAFLSNPLLAPAADCPHEASLRDYLRGGLTPDHRNQIEKHLADCGPCFDVFTALHDESVLDAVAMPTALRLRLEGLLPRAQQGQSRTTHKAVTHSRRSARRVVAFRRLTGASGAGAYVAAAAGILILILGIAILSGPRKSHPRDIAHRNGKDRPAAAASDPSGAADTAQAASPDAEAAPVLPRTETAAANPPSGFTRKDAPAAAPPDAPAPRFTAAPAPQPPAAPAPQRATGSAAAPLAQIPQPPAPKPDAPPSSDATVARAVLPVALAKVEGPLQFTRGRSTAALKDGAEVLPGDRLFTRSAPARFTLPNGVAVALNGGTEFTLGRDADFTRLHMAAGEVYVAAPRGTTDFRVATRDAEAIIQGTVYDVKLQRGRTHLTVVEGRVLFKTPKNEVVADAGYQTEADASGAQPVRPADFTQPLAAWRQSLPGGAPESRGGIAAPAGEVVFSETFDDKIAGKLALKQVYKEPGGWGVPPFAEKSWLDAEIFVSNFRRPGGRSLAISRSGDAPEPVLYSPAIPVKRDTAYEYRLIARTTAPTPQKFKAYLYGEEGTYGHFVAGQEFTVGAAWKEFTGATRVPPAAGFPEDRRCWIRLDWASKDGDLWIDEIALYRK